MTDRNKDIVSFQRQHLLAILLAKKERGWQSRISRASGDRRSQLVEQGVEEPRKYRYLDDVTGNLIFFFFFQYGARF